MAPSLSHYVRVNIDGASDESADDQSPPIDTQDPGSALTFVDLHTHLRAPRPSGVLQLEPMTNAVQEHLHLCSRTARVLFRWPWIAGPGDNSDVKLIESWIDRLVSTDRGEAVFSPTVRIGVIQHRIADSPILRWGHDEPQDVEQDLCHARAIEIEAMLRRRNAIWQPRDYHYRLPSGKHTDIFIRVADAISEPRDAYVMACWMSDRLRNGAGIVVDTGGLTPLIIQLESFMARFGLQIGPTAVLATYPSGRPMVRRTVEFARGELPDRVIAVISVSSTGTLLNTLLDELERATPGNDLDFTLDVLVDRSAGRESPPKFTPNSSTEFVSWVNLESTAEPHSSSSCQFCDHAENTPVVAVDPRTYGAMTLPRPHLVMPDIKYASAGHLFWECASESKGRAVEVNPHHGSRAARGKRTPLPVRPIFELVGQAEKLDEAVRKRWLTIVNETSDRSQKLTEFGQTALVIAPRYDLDVVSTPVPVIGSQINLKDCVRRVLNGIGIDQAAPIICASDQAALDKQLADLDRDCPILLFSWGSVTGLTLRNMKLSVADALQSKSMERSVNGLVVQARSSTPSEWTAQQNQFRPGVLQCLWESCFPWRSPLQDESRLLDRADIDADGLSDRAQQFLTQRLQFLDLYSTYADYHDDWSPRFNQSAASPHPEHVFWGMSRDNMHQQHVRGRSLYGKDLDCITAYAALGSTINYTRLIEQPRAAPRWVMFDMARIVRSYFDAIITCSVIRWLQPGELWWAERDDPESIRESVAFLLDQAADPQEQMLIVPELLLASAQGKVPTLAHDIVHDRAREIITGWPDDPSFDIARGATEIGLRLLERS